MIAGQHPNVRRARKSVASFKLREGMPVGVSVTLRRARMWEFLDRLTSIAVPRIRDFRGLNPRSLRRPRQLLDGRQRAADLPGNRLRLGRRGARPRRDDHDHGADRRGGVRAAARARHAVRRRRAVPARPSAKRGRRGRGGAAQGGGARCKAEAEQAALEQLKEENPEAYAKPETDEDEGEGEGADEGEATRPARAAGRGELETTMAKTSQKVRQGRKAKYKTRELQPLPPLRPPARLLPQVRPLPDLPARGRPRGLHPRHDEVELVDAMHTDPIADYLTRIRNAHPRRPRRRGDPRLAPEDGDLAHPQGAGLHHRLPRRSPRASARRSRSTSSTPRTASPVISGIERVSRPGRRRYVDHKNVPRVQGGIGTAIVTTSTRRDDRPRGPPARASAARSSPTSGEAHRTF